MNIPSPSNSRFLSSVVPCHICRILGRRTFRIGPMSAALIALMVTACGTGGHEYWLYPEPRLDPAEEAVLIIRSMDLVLAVDEEETAVRCWGEVGGPRPYSQGVPSCRLHIQPGDHVVTFSPGPNAQRTATLTFSADPGKEYGMDWSACTQGSVSPAHQRVRTCYVNVVEIADSSSSYPSSPR